MDFLGLKIVLPVLGIVVFIVLLPFFAVDKGEMSKVPVVQLTARRWIAHQFLGH